MTKAEQGMIPEGYKQTEVGVIPEDWEVNTLAKLCSYINDGTHHTPNYVDNGIHFYSVENVTANDFVNTKFITLEEHNKLIQRCKPEKGDILMTRIGTIAKTKLIDWDVDASIYVSLALLKLKDLVDPKYVYSYTKSQQFYADVEKRSLVNATPQKINMADIGQVPVIYPSNKLEQTAIANALSDVDNLIAALETLIAKKSAIKTAAMQQLLTGKTRLPAFANQGEGQGAKQGQHQPAGSASIAEAPQRKDSTQTTPRPGYKQTELGEIPEDWEVTTLNNLAIIKSGGTPSTAIGSHWNGDVNWCTPTDITGLKGGKYLFDTSRKITDFGLINSSAEMLPIGTVVMTSRATIGECAITAVDMSTNQGFKNFICTDSADNEFMYYLLGSLKNRFVGLCSGSTFLEISTTQVRNFNVAVPEVKEQTAIANVLSDMDTELDALQQRLSKTQQIKQGMMQELLTGKTRLV